jgi:hypothetical protein
MAVRKKRVPASQLTIDRRVQRHELNQSTLTEIRDGYNRAALQTLQISERADGTLVILDGWHRWTIAQEKEGDEFVLDCHVHTGLGIGEEAALFLQFNNQKPANKIDLFYVRVTREDPVALAIKKITADNAWSVGTGKGEIGAVDTLETVFNNGERFEETSGPTLLHHTLSVISRAWGNDDPKAVDRNILGALGQFLLQVDKYEAKQGTDLKFDLDRLATNIRTYVKNGPGGWLSSCRGIAEGTSKTLRKALMGELFDIYNKGKGGRKLPINFLAV